ncbi:hypothetical protein BZA05DRAFT_401616 [Tricharina praecox]|uniref:uncharacterized protein n=1 Tax=Tricharina praecox TaxID=43433 RepID=UPI00221E9553|nr:uncharacterized protein BZA05DRAFT_401616 [Tricharina praecox]KAI5849808.1 hypothetical protein BZA05DRAFT_401616 [Tricharina praecox]
MVAHRLESPRGDPTRNRANPERAITSRSCSTPLTPRGNPRLNFHRCNRYRYIGRTMHIRGALAHWRRLRVIGVVSASQITSSSVHPSRLSHHIPLRPPLPAVPDTSSGPWTSQRSSFRLGSGLQTDGHNSHPLRAPGGGTYHGAKTGRTTTRGFQSAPRYSTYRTCLLGPTYLCSYSHARLPGYYLLPSQHRRQKAQ